MVWLQLVKKFMWMTILFLLLIYFYFRFVSNPKPKTGCVCFLCPLSGLRQTVLLPSEHTATKIKMTKCIPLKYNFYFGAVKRQRCVVCMSINWNEYNLLDWTINLDNLQVWSAETYKSAVFVTHTYIFCTCPDGLLYPLWVFIFHRLVACRHPINSILSWLNFLFPKSNSN